MSYVNFAAKNPPTMQPRLPEMLPQPRPFLRWAGGKAWLVSQLRNSFPDNFNSYFEPFLGGGAVFFSLAASIKTAYLSDINPELVNAYKQIRNKPNEVINHLSAFGRSEDDYYLVRGQQFSDKSLQAARFIYLNKMSFNGIYRVNRNGIFNVPYGHNDTAPIYDEANILSVSGCLKKAKVYKRDFASIIDRVSKNDFVFLDPPYTVAHSNNGFIEYNQKLFTWKDQHRLAHLIEIIREKNAKFLLTNAFHESVASLFGKLGNVHEVPRPSTITSVVSKRSKIKEYIITNCF